MPINPSIALQVQSPQVSSPLNRFAQYQGLAMNKVKMDQYTSEVAERNALAKMVGQVDLTTPEGQNAILKVAPITGPAILKNMNQSNEALTNTRAKAFDLKAKQIDRAIKDIAGYTSPEATLEGIQHHLTAGDIDQGAAQKLVQGLKDAPSFEAWQMNMLRGMLDAKDRLAQTFTSQDLGGSTRVISTPTYGGGPARTVAGSTAAKTMTPGESNPNVVASTTTGVDGTIHHFNRFGQEINAIKGAGQPSATYQKTQAQRTQLNADLDSAISELDKATQPGGLIETATGSGAGALRDTAAGFFGHPTKGAIAIGALAPIYDKVLKMVPRFEGPQSDKDTQLYRDASGDLANPKVPTETKMAAAKEILRLMKKRRNQFLTPDMAANGTGGTAPAGGVDTSNPLLQ